MAEIGSAELLSTQTEAYAQSHSGWFPCSITGWHFLHILSMLMWKCGTVKHSRIKNCGSGHSQNQITPSSPIPNISDKFHTNSCWLSSNVGHKQTSFFYHRSPITVSIENTLYILKYPIYASSNRKITAWWKGRQTVVQCFLMYYGVLNEFYDLDKAPFFYALIGRCSRLLPYLLYA